MKRRLSAILLSLIMAGSLFGCSRMVYTNETLLNSTKLIDSLNKSVSVKELDSGYTEGLNQFAYQIFSEMKGDENVFISPYSISMALSMLYNGADGKTRQEMAKLLGFDLLTGYSDKYSEASNQYMNSNSKYIIEALKNADPKVTIEVANSIWLARGIRFKDSMEDALLAPVRNYYNTDIFQVDFTDDKTLDNVNKWVSKHTDKMIDPFLDKFQDKESLRLFLVNAIYFNGKWSNPFSPEKTDTASFYGIDSMQNVDMMHMYSEKYRYFTDYGMRGIEIPYGNEEIVMDVLIPEDADKYVKDIYGSLTTDELTGFLNQLDASEKTEINTLALPKFEMEYGLVSLNNALQNLGMTSAFGPEADFGKIGDNLGISDVAHKAKIQVEEWGTKAAAATGIQVYGTALQISDQINFIVDNPFIFFIRDKKTGSILFMGEMDQLN